MTNPFFITIADTFTKAMEEEGYEVLLVSGEFDVARQRSQVQDFISRPVDAIVLCPCDSRSIGPVIREANSAGIPVFTADIACLDADAKVVSHIATDNYGGGKHAAEAMIEALGASGGRIAILDDKKNEACLLRVKGFREGVDRHNSAPEAQPLEIVAELPGDGQKDKAFKVTEDLLQAHSELAGIFAINDPSALGARAAIEKANRADSIKIIGFDGQLEGKQAIKEGKIFADPVQFPEKIGEMTAKSILQYFAGDEVAPVQLIPTSLYRKSDADKDPMLQP